MTKAIAKGSSGMATSTGHDFPNDKIKNGMAQTTQRPQPRHALGDGKSHHGKQHGIHLFGILSIDFVHGIGST